VVAGDPEDLREAFAEDGQGPLDVGDAFADVAGHEEPVLRGFWLERRHDLAVLLVGDVQVRYGREVAHPSHPNGLVMPVALPCRRTCPVWEIRSAGGDLC